MKDDFLNKTIDRFISKVDKTDTCWNWTASTRGSNNYGSFKLLGKNEMAHRVSYRLFVGIIPNNKLVLHSCDNPICVNPDHLRIGTPQDNMDDKMKRGRHKCNTKRGTHCKHGHEFNETNTWTDPKGRHRRVCRVCVKLRKRGYDAKKKLLKEVSIGD